jgi:hypothetical protein
VIDSARRASGRVLVLALALAACAPPAPDEATEAEPADTIPPPPYSEETLPSGSPPSAGSPGAPVELQRPATRRGVIAIEGATDSIDLRLTRSPDDFPVRFSTYVPADMVPETETTPNGFAFEVVASFQGRRNDRAYVQFFFYPPGTSLALARSTVDSFVSGLNPEIDRSRPAMPYPWAIERTAFSYPHEDELFIGSIALAQRGNVVFHYLEHYPAEYGDGMAGRIATILDEWRWGDGTSLGR